jgi:hypothetical protein
LRADLHEVDDRHQGAQIPKPAHQPVGPARDR